MGPIPRPLWWVLVTELRTGDVVGASGAGFWAVSAGQSRQDGVRQAGRVAGQRAGTRLMTAGAWERGGQEEVPRLAREGGGAEGLGPPPPSGWNGRVPRGSMFAFVPFCRKSFGS